MNTSFKLIFNLIIFCYLSCLISCNKKTAQTPVVTTSEVSNIAQTTATSGGNITADTTLQIISKGVCWSNSTDPTITNNVTIDGSGTGFFSSSLTGLQAGTTYHVRAYGSYEAGTAYGSDVQFTTSGTPDGGSPAGAKIIEGQAYVNSASSWNGVTITRSTAIALIFRNNSITSVNTQGYLLQAGDESPGSTNNHLDGEIISGNKFIWNGTDKAIVITHGIFTGYNKNVSILYNYLFRVPTGIVLKSNGMTNTSGGVAYNIINQTGNIGITVKGINGSQIYNNTFYSSEPTFSGNSNPGTAYGLITIFANDVTKAFSAGTKIKNNIFYTVNQISNITIEDSQDLAGFESDYNVFWCEAGTPLFDYLGTSKTFAQWQALGFDTHSVVINPGFINLTDFTPAVRLDYGIDLGVTWQTGLSVDAAWNLGTGPATTVQNGPWQVGARVR